MISGSVNANREARVRLFLRGPGGQEREVEAMVDTGFNGFLTLPSAFIAALELPRIGRGRALLADGREEVFDIYEATLIWDGVERRVEADGADTDFLLGMALLDGCDMRLDASIGGKITIKTRA